MFDSATLRQPRRKDGRFDIGRLLDAMLYYERVNLILDPSSYLGIVAQLGLDDTKALLSHSTLVVSLVPEILAVRKEERNGVETYSPAFIQWAGDKEHPIEPDDVVGTIVHQMRRRGDEAKRSQVNSSLKNVSKTKLQRILGKSYSLDSYNSLIGDIETVKLFTFAVAQRFGWGLDVIALQHLEMTVVHLGNGAFIASNPGLESLFPGGEVADWGLILNAVNDYTLELHLGQTLSSDLIGSPESAEIADARIDMSLQRATKNYERIRAFETATFNEARLFGEAFNEGRLTIGGALNLVDRSRPMRDWMRALPPDADLLNEYQVALSKDTLRDVPRSIAKFALFSGIGALLHPVAALGLSAFDTFVVENLVAGWRPNLFVKNVREFIPAKDDE